MHIRPLAFFFALLFVPFIIAGCNSSSDAPAPTPNGSTACTGGSGVLSCCNSSVSSKVTLSPYFSKPTALASNTGYDEAPGDDMPLFSSHSNATVGGTVTYEDKPFDELGFTGETPAPKLPVRQAIVEVLDDTGTLVASGATNDLGGYSIIFDVSSTSGNVYVRALADSSSTFAATVMDNEIDRAVYAVSSNTVAISAGDSAVMNLTAGESGAGAAFNIFDMMITAQENVQSLSSATTPQVDAYWYDGYGDGPGEGTFYLPQLQNGVIVPSIFLLGAPTSGSFAGDSDAYDDTVILHEMGHYASAAYSRDDSPGGSHALTGQYDLRLTWSEGWATFFGSMIRNSKLYVDSSANGGFTFELETPTPNGTGADNELAVAAILWDINDPANESFDTIAAGITGIWDIFENRLPSASVATFETFWDAWETYMLSGQLAPLLKDRDIKYYEDQYETPKDDTTSAARTVSSGISEQHTLFPTDDKDYWKINVKSGTTYTFKTETLGDGADTILTIYDSGGATQLAQNDDDPDRATASNLQWKASRIKCTANSNTTVYLVAEPYRPLVYSDPAAVSQYGHYTFTITAQ